MIRKSSILLVSVLCLGLFFEGCGSTKLSSTSKQEPSTKTAATAETTPQSNEISLWTSSAVWGDTLSKEFKEKNKNVNIKVKNFDYDSANKEYTKALSSGIGPDVMEIDSAFFGQYVVDGVLEDLSKEPYNAGKYEKDFPKDVWESNLSIDNKSILAMTRVRTPNLTFYRADIMQENGFPSDPEELGKFIENPDNLLAIANKLKEKDQYIFQWNTDVYDLYAKSIGIFDNNLKYIRDNDRMVTGIDIGRKVHRLGYESEISFWNDDGKKAVQSSKLVMLHNLGPWAADLLQGYAPDQKGKWRATRSAFGLSDWGSDTRVCINAQSKNKELAWKFVEFVATYKGQSAYMVPGYTPARKNSADMATKNEFLGGQSLRALCEEEASKMKQYKLTPLDDKAVQLYYKKLYDAKYSSMEPSRAVAEMAKDINSEMEEEKQALLKQVKK